METIRVEKNNPYEARQIHFAELLRLLLAPVPLFVIQPILSKIVRRISKNRSELFNRIGPHKDKLFLIDPTNLPFVFVLKAHPEHPFLKAYRRRKAPKTESRISGTVLTLMDMVDGRLDGDALFFTRALSVEGDTEAVVCLRNALDDLDGSIIEDVADLFGPVGRQSLSILRRTRHYGSK